MTLRRTQVLTGTSFDGVNLEDADFSEAFIGDFELRKICKNPTLKGVRAPGAPLFFFLKFRAGRARVCAGEPDDRRAHARERRLRRLDPVRAPLESHVRFPLGAKTVVAKRFECPHTAW